MAFALLKNTQYNASQISQNFVHMMPNHAKISLARVEEIFFVFFNLAWSKTISLSDNLSIRQSLYQTIFPSAPPPVA